MSDQRSVQRKEEIYDEEVRRREKERHKRKEYEVGEFPPLKLERKVRTPEEIKIPVVKLEKPKVEVREVEIDKKVPEIKEESVKVKIPIITLEKPEVRLRQVKLDCKLPGIRSDERKLDVPLIRLSRPRVVRCIIHTFDNRLPRFQSRTRALTIPIYRAPKCVVRKTITFFDSRVDPQVLQRLSNRIEKIEEDLAGDRVEATLAEGEPSIGGGVLKEIPDIMDFVFGVPNSRLSSGGPKIILYKELRNDSTIGSFETLCIRTYREKEGGEPEFKPINKLDEFNRKELEKWLDTDRKLISVDLDRAVEEEFRKLENWDRAREAVKRWFCVENLRETFGRAVVGSTGFLIFKTCDDNLYNHCLNVVENLLKEIKHNLDAIYVKPKELKSEIKRQLASLAWGNLKLDESELIGLTTLDSIFNKCSQDLFKKRLESLEKENGGIYVYATNQHKGEESREHLQMKWFMVKLLSRERKLKTLVEIRSIIRTEEEYEGVFPDIRIGDTVYEVETLFSEDREGKVPKKKIWDTITKYENTSVKEINVVLDNLTFLRHLPDLIELSKAVKEWSKMYGKVVNFYTIDIQNNRLIPLEDVVKKVKRLLT